VVSVGFGTVCIEVHANASIAASCLNGLLRTKLTMSLKLIGVDLPEGVGVMCAMAGVSLDEEEEEGVVVVVVEV
jgi:hypothetical protein